MKSLLSYKDFFFTLVQQGIAELEELGTTLEEFLERELAGFKRWADEQARKLGEEQRADFYDFYSDDYYKFSDTFPSTVRSSLIVTCYSFLETNLLRLCSEMQREKSLTLGAEDLSGKGIFQAQKYLKKVLQFDFPDTTVERQEITKVNKLRNSIVHKQGRAKSGNKELRDYIDDNKKFLELNNVSKLKISKDYVPHFLSVISGLFSVIQKRLPR